LDGLHVLALLAGLSSAAAPMTPPENTQPEYGEASSHCVRLLKAGRV